MNLLDLLHAQTKDPANMRGRVALVTGVGPGSLTVDLDDGVGGYLPSIPTSAIYRDAAVGDVAMVETLGSAWIAAYPISRGGAVFPNVLRNPGFESDAIATFPGNDSATLSREDEPYGYGILWVNAPGVGKTAIVAGGAQHSGSRCFRYTVTDGTDFWMITATGVSQADPSWPNVSEYPDPIPVVPGQVWRIGAWARSSAALPAAVRLRIGYDVASFDGVGVTWGTMITPTTTWNGYQTLYTIPGGVTQIVPAWSVEAYSATGATGAHVFLDDLVVQRVS